VTEALTLQLNPSVCIESGYAALGGGCPIEDGEALTGGIEIVRLLGREADLQPVADLDARAPARLHQYVWSSPADLGD
jgi:hypothetical protein